MAYLMFSDGYLVQLYEIQEVTERVGFYILMAAAERKRLEV